MQRVPVQRTETASGNLRVAASKLQQRQNAVSYTHLNIEDPDILISFKSIDGAFLVFSGQIGITEAYAQHRFMVKGDIAEIMSIVRCIELAEVYLFPKIITKRILRRVPGKQLGSFRVYCHSLLGF